MAVKYKWLAEQLRKKVYDNMEKGIPRFPSEQELCLHYRVSRQTVRQSLALLEQEGLIVRRQGSGSYITGLTRGENTIGLLLADEQDGYHGALLDSLRQTLTQKGFSTDLHITGNRTYTERDILSGLLVSLPRGLIVEGVKSALPNPNLDLYRQFHSRGIPIVFLSGFYGALSQIPVIKEDDLAGSALLTKYLLQQGHRTLGAVFKSDDIQGIERYQGFAETMRESGLPVQDERICWFVTEDLDLTYSAPYDFLHRVAQRRLQGCSAVICHNGETAYWLSRILQDTAIASCENTYSGAGEFSSFITLERNPRELGNMAARAITDRLRGLPVLSQELPLRIIPFPPYGIPWDSGHDFS